MKRPLKQGSKVYCNCYVGNRQDDRSFLCRGVVSESYDNKVMKVLITGVNTFTIGEPVSNRVLKTLLGKTVPRNVDQVSTALSVISAKLYESGKWLSWEEDKIKRILKQQKEKKSTEKKDGEQKTKPPTGRTDARPPRKHKQKTRDHRKENRKAGKRPGGKPVLLQTPERPKQGDAKGDQGGGEGVRTGDGSDRKV